MAHRVILYEAMNSLNRGHNIVQLGESYTYLYLEHCPHIAIVFDMLKENKWIKLQKQEGIAHYWTLSEEGEKIFHEGHGWYNAMSHWDRLLACFGYLRKKFR